LRLDVLFDDVWLNLSAFIFALVSVHVCPECPGFRIVAVLLTGKIITNGIGGMVSDRLAG
jgi:hypothetical protein